MGNLEQRQQQIIDEFTQFDDWMDRYEYLIEIGKELPPMPQQYVTNQYLIKGCQSQVWLKADFNNGLLNFIADADAIITKGIVALLIRALNQLPPADIINAELYFVDKIGLRQNLSPTRSNGLNAMIKQIKMYALAYQTKINGV